MKSPCSILVRVSAVFARPNKQKPFSVSALECGPMTRYTAFSTTMTTRKKHVEAPGSRAIVESF